MTKDGGIWSHIIFRRNLFEVADEESWRDLEPYNFSPETFWGSWWESWQDLEPYNFSLDSFWGSWWTKLAGSEAEVVIFLGINHSTFIFSRSYLFWARRWWEGQTTQHFFFRGRIPLYIYFFEVVIIILGTPLKHAVFQRTHCFSALVYFKNTLKPQNFRMDYFEE